MFDIFEFLEMLVAFLAANAGATVAGLVFVLLFAVALVPRARRELRVEREAREQKAAQR